MRVLLLPLLFLPLIPAKAKQPDIKCPGNNTLEMRWCAANSFQASKAALETKLSPEALAKWAAATQEVCAAAYAPYRQGTIYPQLVVGCDDRLNRMLLNEFRGLSLTH